MKLAEAAVIALWMALPGMAAAQEYPGKPVRLYAGSNPGAPTDLCGRLVAAPLREMWMQDVIVENRPGAGGSAAGVMVSQAPVDGHLLLICSLSSHALGPAIQKSRPYDHIKDFAPISPIGMVPYVLIVHPSLPAHSLKELVGLAKTYPDKIRYASSGAGNVPHLSMELLRSMAGIRIVHVPLGPDPAMIQEITSGRLMAGFSALARAAPLIKSGKARGLGVSSAKRHPQLPEIPAIAEAGLNGFDVTGWSGLCAPAATPAPIITKLGGDLRKALALPQTQQRAMELGIEIMSSTSSEFSAFIQAETVKWADVARNAGLVEK